jgi:hypothetical protein
LGSSCCQAEEEELPDAEIVFADEELFVVTNTAGILKREAI